MTTSSGIDTSGGAKAPRALSPGRLVALAVLLLLWMAFSVRWRGAFGRKTSVALRTLSPIPLGLGGWLLGALVVLAMLPTVSLDDELLATLSVGVPVGLGIYLAWVNREWSGRTRLGGWAAAVGGALVGAWLGFHATEGLVALFTAIVGAAAGGNLLVLGLDMVRDSQSPGRVAARPAEGTLDARSSIR